MYVYAIHTYVPPLQLCQGHCGSCGLLPHLDGGGSEGPPSGAQADQDERYVHTHLGQSWR